MKALARNILQCFFFFHCSIAVLESSGDTNYFTFGRLATNEHAIKSKLVNIKHTLVFIHTLKYYRPFEGIFCEQLAHKSEIFALILLQPSKRTRWALDKKIEA